MMVFLPFFIFSSRTSKFRHSLTKKRELLPQTPYRGFAPTSVPRPPGPPPFAHSRYATVHAQIIRSKGGQMMQWLSFPIRTYTPWWWHGLVVARWSRSTSYSTPDPVSTWMGDRMWAGKPSRYVTSHLGQLSLPSLRGR